MNRESLHQLIKTIRQSHQLLQQQADQSSQSQQGTVTGDQQYLATALKELVTAVEELHQRNEETLRQKTLFIQLLQKISMAVNEAQTGESALRFALECICTHSGWPVGHVYLLEPDSPDQLTPTTIWYLADTKQFESFRKVTESTYFAPDEGFVGQVFSTGRAGWIKDVGQDTDFIRARQARQVGLKTALAFPVLIRKTVVAVLEFYSTQVMEPGEPLLELISHIGLQLGLIVEREQSERLLAYQAYLLNNIYDAIMAADEQFVKTAWNRATEELVELLTPRQREVLQLVVEGLTNTEIGQQLNISPRTVEMHRSNLMQKLGLRNQAELIRFALVHGLILPEGILG